MNERRPPTRPGRPGARSSARTPRHGHAGALDEPTDTSTPFDTPRPGLARDGFDQGANTTAAVPEELHTSDISLIEAEEVRPARSDPGFRLPPRASVFVPPPGAFEGTDFDGQRDTADATAAEPDLSTDSDPAAGRPVAVKKWRMGKDEAPEAAPGPQRVRTSVVPLPEDGAARLPALRGAPPAASPHAPDVVALRRALLETQEILQGLSVQLSSREGQGAKAQLNAALHRIGEALALLKRS
ncbi:MAG: hypothetical protein IT382_16370 [Deltaproteobacteria bacterium]|nr:hypothetical protein [Deltaproteobacteria bacterium]